MTILPEVDSVRESIAATEVDVAFAELDCCWKPKRAPHGGTVGGFWDAHGCTTGWLCQEHTSFVVAVKIKELRDALDRGYITCSDCKGKFYSVDDFAKVWVL